MWFFDPLLPASAQEQAGGGGVTGTSATTNAPDTSSASGTTTVVGTSATTNAHDTSSASGTTTVVGTSATTNANDTSSASGTVGSGGSSGTAAVTNADDTAAASGTTTVVGTSATTNAGDTANASGFAGAVSGTVAVTNADDIAQAFGSGGPVQQVVRGGGGRNYIIKGRKYYNLTNEELAYLLARELIDAQRADIRVEYGNKTRRITRGDFAAVVKQAKAPVKEAAPVWDDEEEAAMLLL